MSEIFLVMEGCYSDRHVVGVYDSRELADAAAAILPQGYVDVEAWPVNTAEAELRQGLKPYHVDIDRHARARADVLDRFSLRDDTLRDDNRWHYRLDVYCWARDEAHAIKIANERRAQWIADGRWDVAKDEVYGRWHEAHRERLSALIRRSDYSGQVEFRERYASVCRELIAEGFVVPVGEESWLTA